MFSRAAWLLTIEPRKHQATCREAGAYEHQAGIRLREAEAAARYQSLIAGMTAAKI